MIAGRRDGTALAYFGDDAQIAKAEDDEALLRGELFVLGVAHQGCFEAARAALRAGRVALPLDLPTVSAKETDEPAERLDLPPSARCPFCGSTAGATEEHVWPEWVSLVLHQHRAAVGKPRPFLVRGVPRRASRLIDVVAPICGRCNNTWLSVLEQDAQPVLTPLINGFPLIGGPPCDLNRTQQFLIATWAVKTALMFDLSSGPEAIIPTGFYRDFALRRRPSPSMWVRIAGFVASHPASARRDALWVGIPQEQHPNGFVTTLSAGALALQIAGHFVKSGTFTDTREWFAQCTQQIWPLTSDTVTWPPGNTVLDADALELWATSVSNRGADQDPDG